MIRPSALQIAEKCGLAPRLAEQYPETSKAAERGTRIHEEIATAIKSGATPTSPEARAALAWLKAEGLAGESEVRVRLEDPETGETITEGTADLLAMVVTP